MLPCQNCGYDNELGRVFCHKCGTRLDLSAIRPPGYIEEESDQKAAARPATGKGGQADEKKLIILGVDQKKKSGTASKAANVIVLVILIAVVGIGAAIVLPPTLPNVDFGDEESGKDAKTKLEQLDEMAKNNYTTTVELTEPEVNWYIGDTLLRDENSAFGKVLDVQIDLEEEHVSCIVKKELYSGIEMVMILTGTPTVSGGRLGFDVTAASAGKLTVPGPGQDWVKTQFANLWEDFAKDRTVLEKLEKVELMRDAVKVTTQGQPIPQRPPQRGPMGGPMGGPMMPQRGIPPVRRAQ